MARGKGIKAKVCFCKLPSCGKNFKSCREDATTCSDKCRKALNRLLGGDDKSRREKAVTEKPGDIFRVLLDGRWIATYAKREAAEQAIAGWLEEFDGEFTIQAKSLGRTVTKGGSL